MESKSNKEEMKFAHARKMAISFQRKGSPLNDTDTIYKIINYT